MTVREILSILLWPMALFIVVWIDSWWSDWGMGRGGGYLERVIQCLNVFFLYYQF